VAAAASVALHVAVVALLVGTSLWRAWPTGPVNVEIKGMSLDELNDLPLGAPAAGEARRRAAEAPRRQQPKAPQPGEGEPATALADPDGGAAPPRPTSVRSYAPEGSRVTALLRLDRLRGTPYATALDALLTNLPDRRDLLEGTGVDLYHDVDALLIATPNPLDYTVTLLAVRHRLSDTAMRAALERGARATGRALSWRTERGRPFAARRATEAHRAGARDHRLILLPAPHLVVVAPPAYRSLILRGGPEVKRARPNRAGRPEHTPDGGTGRGDGGEDGGTPGTQTNGGARPDAGARPDGGADDPEGWAALLRRIDAEDSVMPPDAVAVVSAADLFAARTVRRAVGAPPDATDAAHPAAGAPPRPLIWGMPVPRILTATFGITPRPFADVAGEMASEEDAILCEQQWPLLRRKLLSNPLVVFTGFSPLVSRARLERSGSVVELRVEATGQEVTRLLEILAAQLTALSPQPR
jgi:hypothetical protein